jgi:hypothetical protein
LKEEPPLILYTISDVDDKIRKHSDRVNFVANGVSLWTPLRAVEIPMRMAANMHQRTNKLFFFVVVAP